MRPLKTSSELIDEGFNAEGSLVFLKGFFEEEKAKILSAMLTASDEDLIIERAKYKYLCSIEKTMEQKIVTGINHAVEQFAQAELDEEEL